MDQWLEWWRITGLLEEKGLEFSAKNKKSDRPALVQELGSGTKGAIAGY
jgi:hypothetical protein